MHKKLLILPLLALMILLLALPETGSRLWQSFAAGEGNDTTVIANIQGVDFTVPDLDKRLAVYAAQGRPQEEESLKRRLVARELFYREACAAGCSVDEATVDAYLADLRQSLPTDAAAYSLFLEELEILGLTEDEYWQEYRQEYVEMMVTGQYYRELEADYWHGRLAPEAPLDFEGYYENTYLPGLFEKYQVVMK